MEIWAENLKLFEPLPLETVRFIADPNSKDLSVFASLCHDRVTDRDSSFTFNHRKRLYQRWLLCNRTTLLATAKSPILKGAEILSASIVLPLRYDAFCAVSTGTLDAIDIGTNEILHLDEKDGYRYFLIDMLSVNDWPLRAGVKEIAGLGFRTLFLHLVYFNIVSGHDHLPILVCDTADPGLQELLPRIGFRISFGPTQRPTTFTLDPTHGSLPPVGEWFLQQYQLLRAKYQTTLTQAAVHFFAGTPSLNLTYDWTRQQFRRLRTSAVDLKGALARQAGRTRESRRERDIRFFASVAGRLTTYVRGLQLAAEIADYVIPLDQLPYLEGLQTPEILNTTVKRIQVLGDGSQLYDHRYRERTILFSNKYLDKWDQHTAARDLSDLERAIGIFIFLIHEFVHITQNLTSYRYQFTDRVEDGLERVDYFADAIAVLLTFVILTKFQMPEDISDGRRWGERWNEDLALLIKVTIVGIEVFLPQKYPSSATRMSWDTLKR